MKSTFTSLLGFVFFSLPFSYAHAWDGYPHPHFHPSWRHCGITSSTSVVSTLLVRFTGSCAPGESLRLGQTSHAYPEMGGRTYQVDYWMGGYQRPALFQATYQTNEYDECTQELRSSTLSTGPLYAASQPFPIDNPNMHDDVRQSFGLLPMTEDEAREAYCRSP